MLVPLFVDFAGKRVAIVGAGKVGIRRAKKFLQAGAKVELFSKEFLEKPLGAKCVRAAISQKNLPRVFSQNPFLVVAATRDVGLNRAIAKKAAQLGVLCSCAGAFEEGDAVVPASANVGKNVFAFCGFGSPARSKIAVEKFKKVLLD